MTLMLTLVHYLIGWPAALVLLAIAASAAVRTLRHREMRRGRGNWTAPLMFGCAAAAALTALGVLPMAAGVAVAVFLLAALVLVVQPWTAEGRKMARTHARAGGRWLREDSRSLTGRLREWIRRLRGGDPEAEASSPEAAVAEAVATRAIPPVMDDPALGVAPEPAELVSGSAPAAAPYVTLAQWIAGFEPEDDMSLRMFMESNAAGSVMVADAWHHFADTCLNSVGLDPAYVAGILEAGDSASGHGSLLAQIHKRLGVIYGAVQEWVATHGPLPHKARQWLTGE